MSQAPSTFGTITTSSRSPIAATTCIRSSSIHGLSSAFMRVQSCVSPSSISEPTRISPSRAASLRSTGMASSRLPSRMSTWGAMSGALATIFSFEKSRKWIIRDGLKGISRSGSGASIASGVKKSLGLRIRPGMLFTHGVNAAAQPSDADRNVAAYERDIGQYADRSLQIPEQMLLRYFRERWPQIAMLDLGVGAGRTAFTFAPLAGRYLGVDISEPMVAVSRALVGESETVRFQTADARTIAEELDGRFDLVLFSFNGLDAVEHADRLVILDQVRRLLADDGLFVFSSHSLATLPLRWAMPPFEPRSPIRSLYGQARALRHRARLRRVNSQIDLEAARKRGWDRIRDGDHGFDLLYYYVLPAHMEKQLADAGFELEAVYDRAGRAVTTGSPGRDPWLYYYC